jgi:thiol-disulfide isomerase/thioredoxin
MIALVVTVALARGDEASTTDPQTSPVENTGSALPTLADAAQDPGVGMTIPTVSGTTLSGEPAAITNDGKAKVVVFVAHWCPHCRREVPLLSAHLGENPLPADVELVTVSTGVNENAPNYPPSAWLAREHWPAPVLADDSGGSAAQAFGLPGFPYFVFVGADGKVVARASGEITIDEFDRHVASISDE